MSVSTPNKMYADAMQRKYALGAFNIFSLESLLAVLDAAEAERSPVIVQVSMGARKYVEHLKAFVDTIYRFAKEYDAPIFLQHDHCTAVEACFEAIDAGMQSVMFDGSHLNYEENVEKTSRVVRYAHERGAWVEAELGCLPGFEDLVFAEHAVYTDPQQAADFVHRTGCDCLAVAAGTSHGGVRAEDYLPLNLDLIAQISHLLPDLPLVLHGGASLPPEMIEACNREGAQVEMLRNCSEASIERSVSVGVRKVNMDVDNFLAFTTDARHFLNEHPDLYDPRKYLKPAQQAFALEVRHKMKNVLHSSGKFD